jgi:hypothetical protein
LVILLASCVRKHDKKKNYKPEWSCLKCLGGNVQDNNGLSMEQMKAALARKGISQLGDASVVEVFALYETVVEADTLSLGEHGSKTLYPLYPTSCLADGTLTAITSFEFSEGGRFIQDPSLTITHIVVIAQLLAATVTLSDKYLDVASTRQEKAVISTLPHIVTYFARNCRPGNN